MSQTAEYRYLEKRIKKLEKHFDFRPGIHGNTPLQEDRLKGFCILCHAEFEDYFESIAKRIFHSSLDEWKTRKVANFQLTSFFVLQEPIELKADTYTKSLLLASRYDDILKSNHGIKEANIKKMYKPLGYDIGDFDPLLISELNTFGERRGASAHSSARHTTIMLDKVTEYDRVDRILNMLIAFESAVKSKYTKL